MVIRLHVVRINKDWLQIVFHKWWKIVWNSSLEMKYFALIFHFRSESWKCTHVQLNMQNNVCLHSKKITLFSNTNANNSTSTRNTKWQCTLTAYHKHLSTSAAKEYRIIESPNVITPQATSLQVAQKLPNKSTAETNRKAPVYWHLKTPKELDTNNKSRHWFSAHNICTKLKCFTNAKFYMD